MRVLSMREMYEIDKYTINTVGISGTVLMERAGTVMADRIANEINSSAKVVVACGKGNNGGDGFVIEKRLQEKGFDVSAFSVDDIDEMMAAIANADVIVDALLGIGTTGKPRAPFDMVIGVINKSAAKVFSVDIPSGVYADEADVDIAVKADITYTVQYPKLSAYLYPAASYYGKLEIVDIGIADVPKDFDNTGLFRKRFIFGLEEYKSSRPERKADSHKGNNGRALIIGGSADMLGAPLLSSLACLKSGIGLLTIAVPKSGRMEIAPQILEAMYLDCEEANGNLAGIKIPSGISIIAVGPGLGRAPESKNIVRTVLESDLPAILDADALFFLSEDPELMKMLATRTAPTILTPHEGEMSRMCGTEAESVHHRRFDLSYEFATANNVYLVLKGPNTILTTPNGCQYINTSGNAGLAKGGSGDVLTGIIAGSIPHYQNHIAQAVACAIYQHGLAADTLVTEGNSIESITPTQIINKLGHLKT